MMGKLMGRGNTAEVFEYGEGKICKLFYQGFSERIVNREYHNAVVMQQAGLPVPKCYERLEEEQRHGIVYERIEGRDLMTCFFESGDAEALAETISALHTQILRCHTQEVISYKTFLLQLIGKDGDKEKELVERIRELPEEDCLCHGDFHPFNILKDEGKSVVLIDFMNVCYGPWQYDVARTYFLLSQGELPEGVTDIEKLQRVRMELADLYLEGMKASYSDIKEYLEVIRLCRPYELAEKV